MKGGGSLSLFLFLAIKFLRARFIYANFLINFSLILQNFFNAKNRFFYSEI